MPLPRRPAGAVDDRDSPHKSNDQRGTMKKTTMNKRADAAPRQEVKGYDPDEVIIIGIDTDDGPSHWGYDEESNKNPLLEADVQFTYENGVIQNVLGRRDGNKVVIVAG